MLVANEHLERTAGDFAIISARNTHRGKYWASSFRIWQGSAPAYWVSEPEMGDFPSLFSNKEVRR